MLAAAMHRCARRSSLTLVLGLATAACGPPSANSQQPEIEVDQPGERVRFAVIGDYGLAGPDAAAVARRVAAWKPDFVITLGDNNYPYGRASTIDDNVGQYYHSFIAPYKGRYGEGADINRFFPSLGNHDWRTPGPHPYLEYFTLPGNERYYDFRWGPVHLFAIDSDYKEPDGNRADSEQARWLREKMSESTLPWQVVYMHHPPWSSGDHGSSEHMRWPFADWGADVIMAGHDHHYERIEREGVVFLVNGLGGNPLRYELHSPVPGSALRYRDEHGATLVEATAEEFTMRFITASGKEIDLRELPHGQP